LTDEMATIRMMKGIRGIMKVDTIMYADRANYRAKRSRRKASLKLEGVKTSTLLE